MEDKEVRKFWWQISIWQIYLKIFNCVRSIVYVKVVIAIKLKFVESQHKSLKDTVSLKRNGTIEIFLVLRRQYSPVDLSVQIIHKMISAYYAHFIWNTEKNIPKINQSINQKLSVLQH